MSEPCHQGEEHGCAPPPPSWRQNNELGRALHAVLVSGKKAQDGQQDDLDANAHVMEVQRERPVRAGTSHRSPVRVHVHIQTYGLNLQ